MATIAVPLDVLGVNYYQPDRASAAPVRVGGRRDPGAATLGRLRRRRFPASRARSTAMGWTIDPAGLRETC